MKTYLNTIGSGHRVRSRVFLGPSLVGPGPLCFMKHYGEIHYECRRVERYKNRHYFAGSAN